jgi:phosphoribosylglycinamide formyltransferase-1
MNKRIAVFVSSAGSAFRESWKILQEYSCKKYNFVVITDRKCGIESFCDENQIEHKYIEYVNREQFSLDACRYIDSTGGIDFAILYFLRILSSQLFTKYLCLNIHPSLLPSFRGVNAVEQFLKSGAKFMGATLHMIDAGVDTGPIIAQVQVPVSPTITMAQANKISFLQKVYLNLLAVDLLESKSLSFNKEYSGFEWTKAMPYSYYANPLLQNQNFLAGFIELQKRENCQII